MLNPNYISELAYDYYLNSDYVNSLKLWKSLLKYNPDEKTKSSIYINIGLSYYSLEEYEKAIEYFKYSNSIVHNGSNDWHLSLCYLNLKNWELGKKYYNGRYRHQSSTSVYFPNFPIPQFSKKEEFKDKNILVMNEQGLGDEIMFSSQLIKLSKIVKSATIKVSESLIDLFKEIYSNLDNIKFSSFDNISYEDIILYDGYLAFGDMFFELYEFGDNISLNLYDNNELNGGIGVCWNTNIKSPNAKLRSVDRRVITDKLDNWTSLQYGEYGFNPNNFLDTYNKIMKLKKVITVDTSIAHLAGLIGIDTDLIINNHYDWRWKFNTNGISDLYNNINLVFLNKF